MKKLSLIAVGVCLIGALAGCSFSIGKTSDSDDYSSVFIDPVTEGKVHTMKTYQFSAGEYGSTNVTVDTTDGADFEVVESPAGFKINTANVKGLLDATCVNSDYYKDYTFDCSNSVYTYNGRDYLRKDNTYCTYLADVGLDCGLVITTDSAKDLSLIAFSGSALSGSSSDVNYYRGKSEEPTSSTEIVTTEDGSVDSEEATTESTSEFSTTSSTKVKDDDSNYNKVKWQYESSFSDYPDLVVSATRVSDGVLIAVTNNGNNTISFSGTVSVMSDSGSKLGNTTLIESCLPSGGTTVSGVTCETSSGLSLQWNSYEVSESHATPGAFTAKVNLDTSSVMESEYGDSAYVNFECNAETNCSFASMYVLVLDSNGNVIGYSIAFPEDTTAGNTTTGDTLVLGDAYSLKNAAAIAVFTNPISM